MSFADRYRQIVSILVALFLGSMTVWAIRIGSSSSVIVLGTLSTIFFVGLAVSTLVDRVSQYKRVGLFVIGLVAAGTLLLGHHSEFAIAMTLMGMGHGVDLLLRRDDILSTS